jgi:Mg2+/Co2+ transporter CorC
MAVMIDEYGGTADLVTLKEIVGNIRIRDEYDTAEKNYTVNILSTMSTIRSTAREAKFPKSGSRHGRRFCDVRSGRHSTS